MNFLIIIINYNNWLDTIECIQSLIVAKIFFENIIVIDNYSNDDSYLRLKEKFPQIEIIKTTNNLGFSGANNVGIRIGLERKVDFIILLNNDTIVKPDSIQNLLKETINHPEVSLSTGQIRYYPEKNEIWYDGGGLISWRGLAVHHNFNKKVKDSFAKRSPSYVSFASGCFLCIRSRDLEKLGFMEEEFFLYLEDIEYSSRAIKKNLKILYVPNSIIYHKANGARKLNKSMSYYSIRNRRLLIKRSFGITAKLYFNIIIRLKNFVWFFINRELYLISKKALSDYDNNKFGKFVN